MRAATAFALGALPREGTRLLCSLQLALQETCRGDTVFTWLCELFYLVQPLWWFGLAPGFSPVATAALVGKDAEAVWGQNSCVQPGDVKPNKSLAAVLQAFFRYSI